MHALLQQWYQPTGEESSLYSVSQSRVDLTVAVEKLEMADKTLVPLGRAIDVVVPDDNELAKKLEKEGTVFIGPDEKHSFIIPK